MVTKKDVKKKFADVLEKLEGCPYCYQEMNTLLDIIDSRIKHNDAVVVKIECDKPHIIITQK
jgi:hypothetical protein